MKTKTVDVAISYEFAGVWTLQLPANLSLEAMRELIELRLENEGFSEDANNFKIKYRDSSASILAVTDGES